MDGLDILTGIADGSTEDDTVLAQQVHGVHDLVEDAFAAAAVVDFAEAFDAEGEAEVADLDDFLAEGIVNEGPIGKGVEFAVRMFPAEFQDVRFTDQRFAASEEVEMAAYFFALAYDFIHDVVGQVQGVTIFGSPAADAVQVAGAGRVEEDGPGNIAVIFGFGFVPRTQTVEARFKA